MTDTYMTCKELVELVTEYFDGALESRDRERFEEHVMTCPPCRSHLDQMRQTLDVLGHVPHESIPADMERDLLDAFRGWRPA